MEIVKNSRAATVNPADISTEVDASKIIRCLALDADWECEEQYKLPNGKKIDFFITAEEGGKTLQFGIECKPRLHFSYERGTHATTLASYFEQCAAYARELNAPVFLGPYLIERAYLPSGGIELSSMDAFNLFGGRVNVGTLSYSYYNYREWDFWALVLRGRRMWRSRGHNAGYNTDAATIVTSQGSKKERAPILTSSSYNVLKEEV